MNRGLLFLIFLAVCSSCNLLDSGDGAPKPSKKMTYSYACLDSAVSGNKASRAIARTTSAIRDLAVDEDRITDAVQNEYGDAFHKDALESKTFVLMNDATAQQRLQNVMTDLLAVRESPSKITYSIYLLLDKEINAFTFGGHIYVTKAMYDKCSGNDALLYSIVGHEMGHSEKGHIKKTIQEMMLSDRLFGRDADAFTYFKKLLAGSFNQRNELEADYYGTDLVYRLNKDVCSAVAFWKEMAKDENQYSKLEDFFRTHPFSNLRAECLQAHIRENFGRNCGSIKPEETMPQVRE